MNTNRKLLKIALVPLVLVSLCAGILGCSSESTSTTTQVTAVIKKGSLVNDITAVGNLSYSTSEELSFDTSGYVSDISVEVGDTVTEGDVVAKLNMTEWEQNVTTLESTLASKQMSLTQAEQSQTTAARNVTTKEKAVATAKTALDTAEYNLTVKERAVESTKLSIESAELSVEQSQYSFDTNSGGQWAWDNLVLAKKQLELTKLSLDDANHNVEVAQQAIEDAKVTIENAQLDVEDAKTAVTIADGNVTKAQQDVADAQQALDDSKATHPELTAPFTGLVTALNTTAGTEVYKGGAIITIVDPSKFEAVVSVSETDINNVQLNGNATVEFDAITGLSMPATVRYISPTATTSSGVVSYQVTITIQSDKALQQGVTQDQLSQLKEGLTATVSIIIEEANDVLLVPTQAIQTGPNGSTVDVISNGTTTTKTITTGISNSKYTAVTEGINEGDTVVYSKTANVASATTASSASNNLNLGGMGGGMSGPPGGQ